MHSRHSNPLNRRNFLGALLGSASTAAMAAAALPLATTEAQAYDPGDETRARYRADSPDVKAFYRTNGYETLKK